MHRPGGHAATQEGSDFGRIDAVILRFATVNSFHIQGVIEHKWQRLLLTPSGEPVPGEQTL